MHLMPVLPRKALALILFGLVIGLGSAVAAARGEQSGEDAADLLLKQADAFFLKGAYKLAMGTYLEASAMSRSPLTLSAAYFGLSQCYFYERDMANTVRWMRKTAEIDPQKEITEAFYAKSFVDLFRQVRDEVRKKGLPAEEAAAAAEPDPKIGETPPPVRGESRREPPPVRAPRDQDPPPFEVPDKSEKGGHWEVSLHFGTWTIDPILSLFESRLIDELSQELQNQIIKELGDYYGGLVKSAFTPALSLDSNGSNYGLEARYFARGWAGTFSLGFSMEKTRLTLAMTGSAQQAFSNGGTAQVEAQANLETAPFSTNFSFRWEIGRGRIRPFISLGFGFAKFDGTASYSYTGTYKFGVLEHSIGETETKTFEQLSEDINFQIPSHIVLFQLSFGLKAEILKSLSLLGEAGIWDGFLLRGGLAFRF